VNLKQVVDWAQGDPNWVIDHGNVYDKTMQTYEWLKKASEHDYDKWYYGVGGQEENFFSRIPSPGAKPYGDLNTPGSLLRDAWDKVAAMPAGSLKTLPEWQYAAMIFETAWHDENPPDGWSGGNWFDAYKSRNYQITFNRPETGSVEDAFPPMDNISGWALRLHGHARTVGIQADAAQWVSAVKNGTQGATTVVEQKDVDEDAQDEFILRNNRVYLCFERQGARLVYGYVFDNATQDAIQVLGVPAANPAEEHDGEGADNNRCSAFKDRWASAPTNNTFYVDANYALTAPAQGSNYWEFVSEDGNIRKRLTLPAGRDVVRGDYTMDAGIGTLYVRHGLGPNQLDLLKRGDANLTVQSDAFYYGLVNSQGGAAFAVNGLNSLRSVNDLPQAGFQNRELPLIEQVELYNTATNFTTYLAFSSGSANDVDGDGLPNQDEITLASNYEDPDTDGDGMEDGFENAYFGSPVAGDPEADPDGDGMTNVQEHDAGTNPLAQASAFRITSIVPAIGGFTITWTTVPGHAYQLAYRDVPTSAFNPLPGDPIIATGSTTNQTDATVGGAAQRQYRVEVIPVP